MKKTGLALVFYMVFLAGGCMTGPFVPVIKLEKESAMRLRKEIPVFDISELRGKDYRRIRQIEAISCMNKIWDPPSSREDAIDQLRFLASVLGGDGITNLICEQREGTNVAKNCWNSITCYGVAIALGPASEKLPNAMAAKSSSVELAKILAEQRQRIKAKQAAIADRSPAKSQIHITYGIPKVAENADHSHYYSAYNFDSYLDSYQLPHYYSDYNLGYQNKMPPWPDTAYKQAEPVNRYRRFVPIPYGGVGTSLLNPSGAGGVGTSLLGDLNKDRSRVGSTGRIGTSLFSE